MLHYKTMWERGFQDGAQKGVEYTIATAIIAVACLTVVATVWGVKSLVGAVKNRSEKKAAKVAATTTSDESKGTKDGTN